MNCRHEIAVTTCSRCCNLCGEDFDDCECFEPMDNEPITDLHIPYEDLEKPTLPSFDKFKEMFK